MKSLFFNPFEKYSEKQLGFFGMVFLIIGLLFSICFKGRLDGVVDLHFVEKITFTRSLIDLVLSFSVVILLLYGVGKLINKKVRFIDICTTCLIAKIPFYFLIPFNFKDRIHLFSQKILGIPSSKIHAGLFTWDVIWFLAFAILSLTFLVWSLYLLYKGFKTATNFKQSKQLLWFIIAFITAEIVSKILILSFNL